MRMRVVRDEERARARGASACASGLADRGRETPTVRVAAHEHEARAPVQPHCVHGEHRHEERADGHAADEARAHRGALRGAERALVAPQLGALAAKGRDSAQRREGLGRDGARARVGVAAGVRVRAERRVDDGAGDGEERDEAEHDERELPALHEGDHKAAEEHGGRAHDVREVLAHGPLEGDRVGRHARRGLARAPGVVPAGVLAQQRAHVGGAQARDLARGREG